MALIPYGLEALVLSLGQVPWSEAVSPAASHCVPLPVAPIDCMALHARNSTSPR